MSVQTHSRETRTSGGVQITDQLRFRRWANCYPDHLFHSARRSLHRIALNDGNLAAIRALVAARIRTKLISSTTPASQEARMASSVSRRWISSSCKTYIINAPSICGYCTLISARPAGSRKAATSPQQVSHCSWLRWIWMVSEGRQVHVANKYRRWKRARAMVVTSRGRSAGSARGSPRQRSPVGDSGNSNQTTSAAD